ncbi:aldehyde dehydrogenase family protein, partial [Rhizobium leguminosarum]|uniref:aldehyde dehydrogenase family protein n=1 Tax=Rhizobium leguminosarum TaxID=384 RepID=UPI003F9D6A3A
AASARSVRPTPVEPVKESFRTRGSASTAANRIYVQSGIHDAFAEKFTRRMADLNVGPGADLDTECGTMITRKAVEKI